MTEKVEDEVKIVADLEKTFLGAEYEPEQWDNMKARSAVYQLHVIEQDILKWKGQYLGIQLKIIRLMRDILHTIKTEVEQP